MRKLIISVVGPLFLILAVIVFGYAYYKKNFLFGLVVVEIGLVGLVRSYDNLLRPTFNAPSLAHKFALTACILPVIVNSVLLCVLIYNYRW